MSASMPAVGVRPATTDDVPALAACYNHYVAHSTATFEEAPVADDEMGRRLADVAAIGLPWLVAEDATGRVVGYAYATRWRTRSGYRWSVEVTVYVAPGHERRGIGRALYTPLLAELRAKGLHAAMAGIALPNDASVALHEGFGFVKVAHFRETGRKFGQWIDVGYWELLLAAP